MRLTSRLNFSNSQIRRAMSVSGLFKAMEKEAQRRHYGLADPPKSGTVVLGSSKDMNMQNSQKSNGFVSTPVTVTIGSPPSGYPGGIMTTAGYVNTVSVQPYPGGPWVLA